MKVAIVLGSVVLLAVAGCGGGDSDTASTPPPTTSAPSSESSSLAPPSTESSSAPATKVTAAGIAATLKAGVPSVTKVVQITEDNDPNNLIGRPTGYLEAAVLYDKGTNCDKLSVDCGVTVEVWPTAEAAKARAAYIQKNLKDMPILGTEYDFTRDSALVRVSGKLKPSVAGKYNALFKGTPYTS